MVILILVGMSAVLLGINHYLLRTTDDSSTDRLRKDVREREDVISQDSLFHKFLLENKRMRSVSRQYHGIRKG